MDALVLIVIWMKKTTMRICLRCLLLLVAIDLATWFQVLVGSFVLRFSNNTATKNRSQTHHVRRTPPRLLRILLRSLYVSRCYPYDTPRAPDKTVKVVDDRVERGGEVV